MGPSCVFNYKNAIKLWVIETENSQKVFSVSITHNSKIRELSDENKKLKTELWLAKPTFFEIWDGSHHFWELSYGNWKLSDENCQSKQPLIFLTFLVFYYWIVIFSKFHTGEQETNFKQTWFQLSLFCLRCSDNVMCQKVGDLRELRWKWLSFISTVHL